MIEQIWTEQTCDLVAPMRSFFGELTTTRVERFERVFVDDAESLGDEAEARRRSIREAVGAPVTALVATRGEHDALQTVGQGCVEGNDAADGRLAVVVDEAGAVVVLRGAVACGVRLERAREQEDVVRVGAARRVEEARGELVRLARVVAERTQAAFQEIAFAQTADTLEREAAEEAALVMEELGQGRLRRRIAALSAGVAAVEGALRARLSDGAHHHGRRTESS